MAQQPRVTIRKANRTDMDFILRRWQIIVGDLVAGHAHFRPSRHAPDVARTRLLTQIDDPDARVFVALAGKRRAGFLNASVYQRSPLFSKEDIGLIENVYVDPEVRLLRVGSSLLAEALGWFRTRKIRAIEAVTAGHNPDATAFFGNHGFDLLSITLLLNLDTAGPRLKQATRETARILRGGGNRRSKR